MLHNDFACHTKSNRNKMTNIKEPLLIFKIMGEILTPEWVTGG